MQTTYFGDSNQYATLTADEGYWLTTWNEADNISTFNAFKTVRLLSERTGLFHEISEEYATELRNRMDKAMEQLASIDENNENISADEN